MTASARKGRVLVGMSGGVDSSATAALLQSEGWEVVGVTLKLWPQDCVSRAEDKCCGPQAVMDARSVCARLGIPYYLVDESDLFQRKVIGYFAEEYRAGRTPNPCVMCNQHLKFGVLLDRARQLGCDRIATGHFARLETDPATGRTLLLKGSDARKDQSYFLFSLRQDQLSRALFPLGERTKSDTREVARACELRTADKEESMEICFVPDNDYGKFLQEAKLAQRHRGDIVDAEGRKLGEHEGVEFYTVGQRRGLGISTPQPVYVVELDAENNRIVVGPESALGCSRFEVANCNWIPWETPPAEVSCRARIRYNHPGVAAVVTPRPDGSASVCLAEPARAVTPGQACVFYGGSDGSLVLGGGWIGRRA
ncbi:MAG: tRNA 2-thiouridine(34) synthase MnmA [Verrucomicrobiae bacterium]|nr:tRNA 2-thiouridine(34) synthase MnmA [Verrucomicrobiae bacterium]